MKYGAEIGNKGLVSKLKIDNMQPVSDSLFNYVRILIILQYRNLWFL